MSRDDSDKKNNKDQISILLADDHPLLRSGIAAWIAMEPDLILAGEASDGESALEAMRELRPDVALVDIEMPVRSGIEVVRASRRERLPVRSIMLTAYKASPYVMASLQAGAAGFVLKTAQFDVLREAVLSVHSGRFFLDPSLSLVDIDVSTEELSGREREILLASAQGLTAQETASKCGITERTVGAHLASIYSKLGAKNKTEAILISLKRGVIFLEDLDIGRSEGGGAA